MGSCLCVPIGDMRHKITIETPTLTPDSVGGFTTSWSTLADVWSKIEPLSARQRFHAMQLEHIVSHKITIRYRSDIESDQRILFEGRTFQIHSFIDPDERHRFLEIMAQENEPS